MTPSRLGSRRATPPASSAPPPRRTRTPSWASWRSSVRACRSERSLFPTHDEYIWPLSRHAERLERFFLLPFSRWEVMQRLHDKRAQLEAAWRAHVDTPKTVFIDGHEDVERGRSPKCRTRRCSSRSTRWRSSGASTATHRRRRRRRTWTRICAGGRGSRHADAAGARARRRRRALQRRLLPGRRLARAGRVHRSQDPAVPGRGRQLPVGREQVGRRAGRRRPAAAGRAAATTA